MLNSNKKVSSVKPIKIKKKIKNTLAIANSTKNLNL